MACVSLECLIEFGKWWSGNDLRRMCSQCEEDSGKPSEYSVTLILCLIAGKKIGKRNWNFEV